jgi:predicted ArsR family transcriptional regulator
MMTGQGEIADGGVIGVLRLRGPLRVAELAAETHVTPTAVRQRLHRLMAEGLVERRVERVGRGRPSHRYSLTAEGLRSSGTNYADLAVALWLEIRSIRDPEVRRGLFERVGRAMARFYADRIGGGSIAERMEGLRKVFQERGVPLQVERGGKLPVVSLACPYPDLARRDRGICAMERMMFSEVLQAGVTLAECRLDGAGCCRFEVN